MNVFLCKNTGFSAFVFFVNLGLCRNNQAVYFSCVVSAAHFLFYGGITMSFSENFKKARKNSGLTQQQLADMLEMDRSSVSKYENGIGLPLANTLQKICEILGVTMDSFFK